MWRTSRVEADSSCGRSCADVRVRRVAIPDSALKATVKRTSSASGFGGLLIPMFLQTCVTGADSHVGTRENEGAQRRRGRRARQETSQTDADRSGRKHGGQSGSQDANGKNDGQDAPAPRARLADTNVRRVVQSGSFLKPNPTDWRRVPPGVPVGRFQAERPSAQRSIRRCSFTLAIICRSGSLSAVSMSSVRSENTLDRLRRSSNSSLASPGPKIRRASGCST